MDLISRLSDPIQLLGYGLPVTILVLAVHEVWSGLRYAFNIYNRKRDNQ
jgi:hypothetical protein